MKPKVLFLDIETSPIKAWIWRTGKQFISHDQVVKGDRTKIICIAYKWEHKGRVEALSWNNKTQDCSKLIDSMVKLIEQADVVIAHNGDKFDIKHINTQRLLCNQPPISWPTSEDTLKQFRQTFSLPTYRLDYISKLLLGEGKSPMAFQDWIDIVENHSEKALAKMIKYCKRDVKLMAKAYAKVKPFLKPKANRSQIINHNPSGCPSCGSQKINKRGTSILATGRYPRFFCTACGHIFRSTLRLS